MRILIYGAGAIGCFIGGHLALAGHDVTLLGRLQLEHAIAQNGLSLHLATGSYVIHNIRAGSQLSDALNNGPFDWIAFTMKAYDTVPAIHELQQVLDKVPPIVCFQNGVGNEESLRAAFGDDTVVAGAVTTPISVPETGVIVEEKQRGVAIASDGAASDMIRTALRSATLSVSTVLSSSSLKWSKLLLNLLANAIPAILDRPPVEAFRERQFFKLEVSALREAINIIRLQKIPLINLPGAPARLLAMVARWMPAPGSWLLISRRVTSGRGDKLPSLLLALRAGQKRTEVAWLNGAVAQAARRLDRLAPINHTLALIVSDIASGRIPWDAYRNNPDHLLRAISTAQWIEDWRYVE